MKSRYIAQPLLCFCGNEAFKSKVTAYQCTFSMTKQQQQQQQQQQLVVVATDKHTGALIK